MGLKSRSFDKKRKLQTLNRQVREDVVVHIEAFLEELDHVTKEDVDALNDDDSDEATRQFGLGYVQCAADSCGLQFSDFVILFAEANGILEADDKEDSDA